MKLTNRNTDPIESKPEPPNPEPPIVQLTKLLLAIAAILTGLSQVINSLPLHH